MFNYIPNIDQVYRYLHSTEMIFVDQTKCYYFSFLEFSFPIFFYATVVIFRLQHQHFISFIFKCDQREIKSISEQTKMEDNGGHENGNKAAFEPRQSALIFLGTGGSGTVPDLRCLMKPSDPPCHVCFQAKSLPPEENPNCRFKFTFSSLTSLHFSVSLNVFNAIY